jgi:hypothetical protein
MALTPGLIRTAATDRFEQPADPQDRVALDEQPDQQRRSRHRGQPLVACGPA